jgi:hypothetical protein
MNARNVALLSMLATALASSLGCNVLLTRSKAKDVILQSFESSDPKPYTAYLRIEGNLATRGSWESDGFDAGTFSHPQKFEDFDSEAFDDLCVLQRLVRAGLVTEAVVENGLRQTNGDMRPHRFYRYTMTPKLQALREGDRSWRVPIGTIHIDDIVAIHHDHLAVTRLLPIGTTYIFPMYAGWRDTASDEDQGNYNPAVVAYAWHIEFNELGRIMTGETSVSGTDFAQFRKKGTLGSWECVTEGWSLAQAHGSMDLLL